MRKRVSEHYEHLCCGQPGSHSAVLCTRAVSRCGAETAWGIGRRVASSTDDNTTAQMDHVEWSCQGLFQPPIWSAATYAPFLDLLAKYLDRVVQDADIGDESEDVSDPSLPMVSMDDDTTPGHITDPLATHTCHHRLRDNREARVPSPPEMNAQLSPLILEESPIRASALVSPEPSLSTTSSSFVTSVSVAARRTAGRHTTFTGHNIPTLSLSAYIQRLARYTGCSAACFLFALSYMLRIDELGSARLNTKTVHRCDFFFYAFEIGRFLSVLLGTVHWHP